LPALPDISQLQTDRLAPLAPPTLLDPLDISEFDTAILMGPSAVVDERTRRFLLAGAHSHAAHVARQEAEELTAHLGRMERVVGEQVREWDALRARSATRSATRISLNADQAQRLHLLTTSIPAMERAIQRWRMTLMAKREDARLHEQAYRSLVAGIGER
jgi:hypothetical protein